MAQKAQSGYVRDGGNSDRQHGHVGHKREPPPFQEWREIVQSETRPNYETKLTQSDVKGVLKFLVGADAETDSLIDDAMEVGAALFLTATHLTVARTFFCNPHQYANNIEATSAWPKDFKERPTMKSLKAMFEKECCASSSSATPSSVTPQRSRLLSSSDESESTKSNVEDEPERETVEEKEEEEHPEEEEPQQEEEQLETSAKRKKEEKDGSGIGRAQTGKEKAQEEQKGQ